MIRSHDFINTMCAEVQSDAIISLKHNNIAMQIFATKCYDICLQLNVHTNDDCFSAINTCKYLTYQFATEYVNTVCN